jgi:hypothetical protein
VTPFGADNAAGDALTEAERAAHGQHVVADFQRVAVSHSRGGQAAGVDRHDRDVGSVVAPHARRMKRAAVRKIDINPLRRGAADNVSICEHILAAVKLDDHA